MGLIMKIYIALALCCGSALGADTGTQFSTATSPIGVQVATTTSPAGIQVTTATNRMGVHHDGTCKSDVFTRDGQTILVCHTYTENGAWEVRMQEFYHDGSLVARSMASPVSQDFAPMAGSQYSVSFRLHGTGDVEFVYISGKDGYLLDGFSCTNGVYYPIDSQAILERNDEIKKGKEADELRRFLIAQ